MSDSLIRPGSGTEGPLPPGGRATRTVTCLLALGIIVSTGAIEIAAPDAEIAPVGAEDRAKAGADDEVAFRDGTMARAAERRIRLQSPVRKAVSPWWSAAVLRLLGDAPDDLIVGKDGYLFLRDRALLPEDTLREAPMRVANYLYALRRRLDTMGIRLISLPIPRKAVVLQEKLPKGVDPGAGLDRALLEELKRRGVEFVDMFEAWEGMPADALYEPMDSHWSTEAQVRVAEKILGEFPELRRDDHRFAFKEVEDKASKDLLSHAGVTPLHAARSLIHQDPMMIIEVDDEATMERITDIRYQGEILLSGTSFVGTGSLQSILAVLLGANLEGRGINGGAMTHSLGIAIKWRESGGELPKVILDEFPIHHLNQFMGRSAKQLRINGGVFQLDGVEEVFPLTSLASWEASAKDGGVVRIPGRSLLSSGDGALSLEITVAETGVELWAVDTGGTRFDLRLGPGETRAVVPVIDGPEWVGAATVRPKGPMGASDRVAVRVVVEGALEEGADIVLEEDASTGAQSSRAPHELLPSDTLFFSWSAPCEALRIELTGRDPEGAPVHDIYTFEEPAAAEAAISPRRLGGGVLERVTVEGPRGPVLLRRVRRPRG